jgi:plastocyanin
MTWLWRICFSVLLATPAVSGTLSGRVELADSKNPEVRRHRDYSGVVVWLETAEGKAPQAAARTAKMMQKGKRFIPHVLGISVGTAVEFPNFDPIFHNAFSNFSGQPFDTGLYPPGTSQKVVFRREGIVHVFCNIHSTMSAVIVVMNTPYITVTDPAGAFRIEGIPAGEYRLKVWHERATEQALRGLERRISLTGDPLELPLLRISESGYLEVPHKNKYGQDYPPESPGYEAHPGVRP